MLKSGHKSRRKFIKQTGLAAGSLMLGSSVFEACTSVKGVEQNYGVQLYTFREQMAADAYGTLQKIAEIGIKHIETARSDKGHYYGMRPNEMKMACQGLGMSLKSGHVHLDDNWEQTMDEAGESGQEYLICSSMPTKGQTVDNYLRTAEAFNKAGEECKSRNIKFGYHNHEYEFESVDNQVLFDVLMDNTQADLVHMELDLGWVIVGGKDPIDYFTKYEGRFPLWHLKDMNMAKKESTEFGKGGLDIPKMLKYQKQSGLKYIFIEQEEYATGPMESMKHNMEYLSNI